MSLKDTKHYIIKPRQSLYAGSHNYIAFREEEFLKAINKFKRVMLDIADDHNLDGLEYDFEDIIGEWRKG